MGMMEYQLYVIDLFRRTVFVQVEKNYPESMGFNNRDFMESQSIISEVAILFYYRLLFRGIAKIFRLNCRIKLK